jgi:Domain of unknown function (DUF4326)
LEEVVITPRVFNRRKGQPRPPFGEPYVYVGRPSRWGNPFHRGGAFPRTGNGAEPRDAIEAFAQHLREQPEIVEAARRELAGKHLVCWCAPARCHADVLLRVANGGEP